MRRISLSFLPLLVLAAGIVVGARAATTGTTLSLVAYSTPKDAYARIIPAFQATAAGKGVSFNQSYGASGDQSRAVAAGLSADVVALSLALAPNMKDKGRYAEIPASDYPPIEQACVILSSSKNKDTAKQFLAFVKTPEATAILKKYGFEVGEPSK